jgi:Na+-translocating ferredoxin:NAD+ oxidoreductase RnfG subunit
MLAPAIVVAAPAYAVQYLTVEQAQAALFPAGTSFAVHPLELSDAQREAIEKEIMDYRETYGGEIRNAAWRQQFVGKHHGDALELGRTIQNISGATLSCRNVMNGVKRLLSMQALALQ